MKLSGMGETESVSQTEYDVTAYRNVLDQLQTVLGEANKLSKYLRADLATTLSAGKMRSRQVQRKLSGYMMQAKGGKDPYRWSQVVGPAIGLGSSKGLPITTLDSWIRKLVGSSSLITRTVHNEGHGIQKGGRSGGGRYVTKSIKTLPFKVDVTSYLFDTHNLIRNVNWEINRLRIEMPFDLRQLTNQMNEWGLRIRRDNWMDAAISEWKIFEKTEQLRKTIIPKMQKRLREKIKETELSKKVAEDTIRKENEKTITKEEREEQEAKKTETRQGGSTSAINLGPVSSGGEGTVTVTASESAKAKELEDAVERLKKENAEMLAENGEGKGGAGLVAGGLALLLLMGQG